MKRMEAVIVKKSVASLVRPNYYVFSPEYIAERFEYQWRSCFNKLKFFLKKRPNQKPFIIRVFIDAKSEQEFQLQIQTIKKSFLLTNVPVSILPEPPEGGNRVMIEVGVADVTKVRVSYGQAETLNFCKLSAVNYAEYWFAGGEGDTGTHSISESADFALNKLYKAFLQLGVGFNNIVRQWNYIEQIVNLQEHRQHYQLFNEIRSKYYLKYRTIPDFPAATGIGKAFYGTTIECMLVESNSDLKIIPICNPRQLNSYKYGQTVLKGEPAVEKKNNQVPQFERAKLITDGKSSRIFISGTASIVGQETIGLGDVEKQTRVTIDNIDLLTSKANLTMHYPKLTVFPDKYVYVRVYVKHKEHIPKVRAICLEHFGQVPMSIVNADICREELLVEIEAEKISYSPNSKQRMNGGETNL